MKLSSLSIAFVFAVSTAVGCGGGQPSAEAPQPPAPAAEPAAPAAPSIDWEASSRGQRLEYMKRVVMPKMKEVFVAFDAKDFAAMKCLTCHGDGAKQETFKMPNPQLPKLSSADHFKKHMDQKPEITRFMLGKVAPQMASLLGLQPYDPKTQKGFGCANCHVVGP